MNVLKTMLFICVLVLLTFNSGCELLRLFSKDEPAPLAINARIYPADQATAVRRVLLYPFGNQTQYKDQTPIVTEALQRAIAKQGCFELVSVAPEDQETYKQINTSGTGKFPMSLLIELGALYHVDAILVGHINIYNPYDPQALGIKADLISVFNGKVLRSMQGFLDANSISVSNDIIKYYQEDCDSRGTIETWRLIRLSPTMYADYACHRFVRAMFPKI